MLPLGGIGSRASLRPSSLRAARSRPRPPLLTSYQCSVVCEGGKCRHEESLCVAFGDARIELTERREHPAASGSSAAGSRPLRMSAGVRSPLAHILRSRSSVRLRRGFYRPGRPSGFPAPVVSFAPPSRPCPVSTMLRSGAPRLRAPDRLPGHAPLRSASCSPGRLTDAGRTR